MSLSRTSLAIAGALELPEQGRILLINPPGMADLTAFPKERVQIQQDFYPDYAALLRRGYDVQHSVVGASATNDSATNDSTGGEFAAACVFLPRAKALALAMVATASAATNGGLVIVDGQKTDGIMPMLKALKSRTEILGTLSKAHGKIAWFRGGDFTDWAASDRKIQGEFVTRPGVFSADGPDKGSQALLAALPDKLKGKGADLGAGWGYLSRAILERDDVTQLELIEADFCALECARVNVTDARAHFHWADATRWGQGAELANAQTNGQAATGTGDKGARLNFVVANPPFHTGRKGDPDLGRAFIRAAAGMLAPSGQLWIVANRHLPYEATLDAYFRHVSEAGGTPGFKVLNAIRPRRVPQPEP